ncbi:fatty acyl-AMP ligase [Nocardia sp. NPDC001965]
MSRFTGQMFSHAECLDHGIVVGKPENMVRRSWSDVHHESRRIAGAVSGHGIGPGSRVAILAGDPGDIAPVVRAMWMRGASITMLHQPTARTDLALWSAQIDVLLGMIEADAVVLGDPFDGLPLPLTVPVLRVVDLLDGPDIDPVDPGEDDTALLQLTSGSTGSPKAIVVTHRNLYANITAMAQRMELRQGRDVTVSWLPLFHDMGMIALLTLPMQLGLDAVLVTPADFLRSPLVWAELIDRYRATITGAPDFAYALLARRLRRTPDHIFDLSSIRVALDGAEPIDCAATASFIADARRFGWSDTALLPAYGMAEATLAISSRPLRSGFGVDTVDSTGIDAGDHARSTSHGRSYAILGTPLPGVEVRVTDRRGAPMGVRRIGEFEIRGDSVTSTYVTTDGIVAAQDAQGWLRTGDIGYRTEGGELVVCGRRKDVIIVSGRNLYPADIERTIGRVTGVRPGNAVAVPVAAGSPDESFAVLAESALHSDTERADRIRQEIDAAIRDAFGVTPKTVVILPPGSLPKTSSGKLRRHRARRLVEL